MTITTRNKNGAISVFEKISNVLQQINCNRKPMIINLIIILKNMQINIDFKSITKSKKTLLYYHNYWHNILKLICNDYIILNK